MRRFVEACRGTRTILPVTTTIERLCADALVDATRPGFRRDLEHLLEETADAGVTWFVWLRQFEWEMFLADAVVETHDRLVGRTYREAARACEAKLGDETAAVRESLRAFAELGTALLGARAPAWPSTR